jgi:glucosyl-3-phosphoglycerate synthase
MSDFHQSGVIATFHRLGAKYDLGAIEATLVEHSSHRPIALILPCLAAELGRPALKNIVAHLQEVRYVRQVVVGLDRADHAQFEQARRFFGRLPQDVRILWRDGRRIRRLTKLMAANDIAVGGPGKGSNMWMASGLVLADDQCKIIALHDCDILSYHRELLARLVFPLANPNMDYVFCKGYYARVSDRLYGRVTRLLVTPLIRALQKILGRDVDLLNFLDSFRYPLAGEFSMLTDLARLNRIPADWGLEIGVLCEVFRNVTNRRLCQVELADVYEHKHQALSPEDPTRGLTKMSVDIAKSLFRNLATEGVVLTDALFNTLSVRYLRSAQDAVAQYEDDAALNALPFRRHDELLAVAAFTKAIRIAADEYLRDPLGIPLISNWNRVTSAIPDFLDRLKDAVNRDSGINQTSK